MLNKLVLNINSLCVVFQIVYLSSCRPTSLRILTPEGAVNCVVIFSMLLDKSLSHVTNLNRCKDSPSLSAYMND